MRSITEETSRPESYSIQGRTVSMPCVVREARSATATWAVPTGAAQALLPGPELEVAEVMPGRGLLSISCIDYLDNDLGDYNEVSIALFVREKGSARGVPYLGAAVAMMRGALPTHILHLPVNQSFTCEAGRVIWGFPKTVDTIDFDTSGARSRCVWTQNGQEVLRVSMPIGGKREFPEQTLSTYSYIDGALHRTDFASSAEGLGVKLGGAVLELGAHPIADDLRSLGLPKPALMSMWMGKMRGRFAAPSLVRG
ncbi:MAG: acetoacetate decarboxylase family protein [Myxococcota bacterium]